MIELLSSADVEYLLKDPNLKSLLKVFRHCDYRWTRFANIVPLEEYYTYRTAIINYYQRDKDRDTKELDIKLKYVYDDDDDNEGGIDNFKEDIEELYRLFIRKAKGKLSSKEVSIPYHIVKHPTKGYIKEFREDSIIEKIKNIPADEKALNIAIELWRLYQDLEVASGYESKDETTQRYKTYLDKLELERAKYSER